MTLRDLARKLELSPTTVSDALKEAPTGYVSPLTRERVRREAERLGYRPNVHARRLTQRRAENVAVLFSAAQWLNGPLPMKLSSIQQRMSALGFEITFCHALRQESRDAHQARETLAALCNQRPALLVLHAPPYGEGLALYTEMARFIREGGVATVFDDDLTPELRALLPETGWDEIVFDRAQNTRLAVEHLLSLGHERIGIFLNPGGWPQGPRAQGACAAVLAAGRNPAAILVPYVIDQPAGFETGRILAEQWLALGPSLRPTGMALLNDETATGFITIARARGVRVPEQVSVVGHDAQPWGAHLAVPLTSVSHPVERIVDAVLDTIASRLETGPTAPARHTAISSELVLRASTAPRPDSP